MYLSLKLTRSRLLAFKCASRFGHLLRNKCVEPQRVVRTCCPRARRQHVPNRPRSVPLRHVQTSIYGILTWLIIRDSRADLNRRYGPLCKEEALWNCLVVSVFSRRDIEAILKRGSRYPLRPPQEVISHYRHSRRDRYTNLGLVNE